MSSLLSHLPSNYGEVIADLKGIGKAQTGIVIPSFGRPEYLARTLASLAQSDLSNSVVCLVDETNSRQQDFNTPGFTCFAGVDSPGHGYGDILESPELLYRTAVEDEDCQAFTSIGQRKRRLALFLRRAPGLKLYVRDRELSLRPLLKARLRLVSGAGPDPRAETLVRHWSLPFTPVVKILKNQHANMYDSYRQAFRMLVSAFDCHYLVCLDSDVIVRADWLTTLLDLYSEQSLAGDGPLIVSGFHTKAHKTIQEGANFRLKESVGGLNLLFSRTVWEDWVDPRLTSLAWDRELGSAVCQAGGRLMVSKPSVVNHIGRSGVWSSWLHYDRASDFVPS